MDLRRKLVVGNWKMNGSLAQLAELGPIAEAAKEAGGVDVGICPPFTLIAPAVTRSAGLMIGAQDCHAKDSGAHTGCVSVAMIKEAGARAVIVGHSERRTLHGETNEAVRAKAEAAQAAGLGVILCVGETEAERDSGEAEAVVGTQLDGSLPRGEGVANKLSVAYEPVWAIGTGRTATPAQAEEVHAFLRGRLAERWGAAAESVRIQYGGSVKPDNARLLLEQPNLDGALVGGASLKADDFLAIVKYR